MQAHENFKRHDLQAAWAPLCHKDAVTILSMCHPCVRKDVTKFLPKLSQHPLRHKGGCWHITEAFLVQVPTWI